MERKWQDNGQNILLFANLKELQLWCYDLHSLKNISLGMICLKKTI